MSAAAMDLPLDLDSASQEDEPSPLEYARAQGLCIDYTTEPVVPLVTSGAHLNAPLDDDFYNFSTPSTTDAILALTKERLVVSRETALLLKAVYTLRESPTVEPLQSCTRSWILALKQELPVLPSDHDLDMLSFGSVASPGFKNLRLPPEIVNEQNDEGFTWPAKYLAYPIQCDAQAKSEKLAVSKDVLRYLQEAVRDTYAAENSDALKAKDTMDSPDPMARPITPPLLPLSPLHVPYIPSSPANHVPLASDSSDSVREEALVLHNQIMAGDSLTRKESDSSDSMLLDLIHPPHLSPLSPSYQTPPSKRKAQDVKVEGPLTPPMFSTSPMKKLKSVSFAATVEEYISYEPWGQDKASVDDDVTSEDFEFFTEIKPLAEKANRLVKNERLSGADTTARVDVPAVDFSLPIAPWTEYSQSIRSDHESHRSKLESQMQFLRRIKREDLKSMPSWHGTSVPEREMQWSFLTTKLSTLKLQETLHGESDVEKFLNEARSGDIATSSAQLWKRDGLRILDEDAEDDLEPAPDEDAQDVEALVRKRKLMMEEENLGERKQRKAAKQPLPAALGTKVDNIHHQIAEERTWQPLSTKTKEKKGTDLMFSGFSATSALRRFLETRGKTAGPMRPSVVEKPLQSSYAHLPDSPNDQTAMSTFEHSINEVPKASCRDEDSTTPTRPLPPLPDIPADLEPCSFIISSKFLQQRSLLRQVEQLFPRAEMVYRDYALPHSPANEADIVISPSTGLVIFSLQQVKQRALPGQAEKSLIKECMVTLQWRYERLIVLVSEGLSRELEELGSGRPEDPRDRQAIEAVEAFAAQLQGDVIVQYIRGGEKALARHMVIAMGRYGLPYGSVDIGDIKPIAQETTHEVFLRRAGLNPFAAQAIVALLKKPVALEVPPCSSSPFPIEPKKIVAKGLCRFLTMGTEERIRSFQALMGGSRVLKGVSGRLDQEWISAAHGFRM